MTYIQVVYKLVKTVSLACFNLVCFLCICFSMNPPWTYNLELYARAVAFRKNILKD